MNTSNRIKYILATFLLLLAITNTNATHLKAGLITAQKISTLQYEFTLVMYLNADPQAAKLVTATLDFGDGSATQTVGGTDSTVLNATTYRKTFIFRHTYGGPGTYTVGFSEQNRNADIVNMTNSVGTPFYVESRITIDPFLRQNTSPQVLSPPIDQGTQNQLFTYSPGAWDADGDSLSFSMSIPKQAKDQNVSGYKDPAAFGGTNENGGTATLSIDPVTGLVTWDRPGQTGLFNIAFVISEWRNGVKIGFVTVDMQIYIVANSNNAPKLFIPADTCITAGLNLKGTIIAKDDPGSEINMYRYGGLFELASNAAATQLKFPPNPQIANDTTVMYFTWQTNCSLVREQPYQATFKAQDNPGNTNSLTAQKVWQIKIKAPSPQGLATSSVAKNMKLKWKKYTSNGCTNVDSIIILRKDCSTYIPSSDSCSTGNNISDGFVAIGRTSASDTTFTDTNYGEGLQYEANYTYIIYAKFAAPQYGYSRASQPIEAKLAFDVPIITNVSVLLTDSLNGKILVRWTRPREINTTDFPAPYTYEIFRKEITKAGTSSGFNLVATNNNINDTTFNDTTGLDTWHSSFSYFTKFYYNNNVLKSTSDTASMVKLAGASKKKRISLGWSYTTPWKNDTTIIYRITGSDTARIDTVYGTTVYTDHGTYNGDTLVPGVAYKYFVETKGYYFCGNTIQKLDISATSLNNFSNMIVAYIYPPDQPDTNKPCPPVLFILSNNDCDNISENNTSSNNILHWNKTLSFYCDSGIAGYKIYSVKTMTDNNFTLFATTTDTSYASNTIGNKAVVGCFAVSAYDSSGNESGLSNIVCSDNCIYYALPNVFTPNGDGTNDKYVPFPTPRFVESVDFSVYNRWGTHVFSRTDNIQLEWDGSNLPDGIYYYNAVVTFLNTSGTRIVKKLNGWIELIR